MERDNTCGLTQTLESFAKVKQFSPMVSKEYSFSLSHVREWLFFVPVRKSYLVHHYYMDKTIFLYIRELNFPH